jgi:VWFA-related protein
MNAVVDAATESLRMLRRRPAETRRVLLLISETRQNGSEGKLKDALELAQFANVLVYTVNMNRLITSLTKKPEYPRPPHIPPGARNLPPGAPKTPEAVAAYTGQYSGNFMPLLVEIFRDVKDIFVSNPAEVLTRYTGGKEHDFASQRGLEQAISDIGEELHSQYMISYSPSNKMEAGFHEISVDVLRPGLEVRTRRGYWMAANPF